MTRPFALPKSAEIRTGEGLSQTIPVLVTEFEMQVEQLGLSKAQYVASVPLKLWCELNRNRAYVPEWLLGAWGITVDGIFHGVL
jgi:hypothetical protein